MPYGDSWRLTYTVWQNGPDSQRVIADCVVTDTTLKDVSSILAKYHAGSWDKYDKIDENVCDGNGFSLSVAYPEFVIRAEGYGAGGNFPEGLKIWPQR